MSGGEGGMESDGEDDEASNVRTKIYPNGSTGPFIVFFRPKLKPLNLISITRDLTRKFSGVSEIKRVHANKIRVVVNNISHANEIVTCELFTLEYRVYIPSRIVECDGVVTEEGLTLDELYECRGYFRNPAVSPVKIIEVKQLFSSSTKDGKTVYSPSNSFRVTFEGSALPKYIEIDKARLPVRLFVPKVMNCQKCKQLGHTTAYCCNKARCIKCGEEHDDSSCTQAATKCLYCDEDALHKLSDCPTYKQRQEKLKLSLKQRSNRTFAEMLKQATEPLNSGNIYDILPSDETVADSINAGASTSGTGNSRKRNNGSPSIRRKEIKLSPQQDRIPNFQPTPPGINPPGFPTLPRPPPLTPKPNPNKPKQGLIGFTVLINQILDALQISTGVRTVVITLIPFVRTFLIKLSEQWPLISTIISFDG